LSEIQARLTNDPNDKDPLHKKQPIAVSNGEIWKSSDDSKHSRFTRTESLALKGFWPELGCVEVGAHAREIIARASTEVAFEPFPARALILSLFLCMSFTSKQ
jgi:hypothetical protein